MTAKEETFLFEATGVIGAGSVVFTINPVATWTPVRPFRIKKISASARVTDGATRVIIPVVEVTMQQTGVSGQRPSGVLVLGAGVTLPLFVYVFTSSDMIELPAIEITAGSPLLIYAELFSTAGAFTLGDGAYLRLIVTGEYV